MVGRNVAVEYRFADGQEARLPVLVAELLRLQVTLLTAFGRPTALAAKAATATVPIVFANGLDPVIDGLVASLNRPGGNATGVSLFTTDLGPKRLALLRELQPKPGTIAFVVDPNNGSTPFQVKEIQAAAQTIGQPLLIAEAGTEDQFDKLFATMAESALGRCRPNVRITPESGRLVDIGRRLKSAIRRHHSITWSARSRMDVGTSSPSVLAVWRLMTNSKRVDCMTGKSAAS